MNEDKKLPMLSLKDLPMFNAVKMKLDCSKAIKTGETQYGTWYLWIAEVTSQKVSEGRGKEAKAIDKYTGKVIFFPTEKMNGELEQLSNGKIGTEVTITKHVEETKKGLLKTYKIDKLSDGVVPSDSLTPGELLLVKDIKELKSEGYKVTETDTITIAKEDKYGGQITEERARELFKTLIM